MIVDSMTYTEILEHLKKDLKIVMHKYEEGTKHYQKYVRSAKNRERVYYEPMRFKSACGFNYVVLFFKKGLTCLLNNDWVKRSMLGIYKREVSMLSLFRCLKKQSGISPSIHLTLWIDTN